MLKSSISYSALFWRLVLLFLVGCKDLKRTAALPSLNRRIRHKEQKHQIEPVHMRDLALLSEQSVPGITIFIHGAQTTRSLLETCLPNTLSKSLLENYTLPDGLYSLDAIGKLLSDYQIPTLTASSIKKIIGHTTLRQWYTLAKTLSEVAPEKFSLKASYFFVWHGHFNRHTRRKAGSALAHIITHIKNNNHTRDLPLTLVTYSHGGNVALNSAPSLELTNTTKVIDTLILLGCPIQEETEPLAHSEVFKHVYSFFTPFDIVQLIAPQRGTGWLFSKQMFKPDPQITQIECLWHGKPLGHFDFIEPEFIQHVPMLIKTLSAPSDIPDILDISPLGAYQVNIE